MSTDWDSFATVSPSLAFGRALAEDQVPLNSAEEYALFQELTFLKVCDHYLQIPAYFRREATFDVVISPMTSYKNHTLRKKSISWKYSGFSRIGWGRVIVEETANPRGYRIVRLWNGDEPGFRRRPEWISWRAAVTNTFD